MSRSGERESIKVDSSPNPQVSIPPLSSTQGAEIVEGNQNVAAYATREGLLKKIEFPTFDGMMPYSLICQVERYFHVAPYTEVHKLELVLLSLTGPVPNWFLRTFSELVTVQKEDDGRIAESLDDEP